MTDPEPRPTAGLRVSAARAGRLAPERARARGASSSARRRWRPTIEPGDWLLVDPTTGRWPRRGTIVVFREPDSDLLAIKRVAAGPGERVDLDDGHLVLAADEAWLLSDASDAELLAAGAGPADRLATLRPGAGRGRSSGGPGSGMGR